MISDQKIVDENFNLHSTLVPESTNGMEVYRMSNLSYVDSGLSCDTFNIIHVFGSGNKLKSEIQFALDHFRNKSSSYCVWISNENLDEGSKKILEKEGLTIQNTEPGMILDLDEYNFSELNEIHTSKISEVTTAQGVHDYSQVIALNWTPIDENVLKYYQLTSNILLENKNRVNYFCYYLDGIPVSGIEMFASDSQTLGIYGLATLKSYRGIGIGTALLKTSLNKAKTDGFRFVVLQASEDGMVLYQKLGFRIVTNYYEYA